MFWNILLLLFFVFTPKVLADDVSVSIVGGATSGIINNQFDIRIKVTASTIGKYYVRADNGSTCLIDMLYHESWSNGCYVGIDAMQPINIDSNGGSSEETLRLRMRNTGSTGPQTLYSYVYDSGNSKVAISSAYSVTINAPTPTQTLTPTPTITPTLTPTLTSTPTKILSPTPTERPIIEPTEVPEITPTIIVTPSLVSDLTIDNSKKTESKNYLPIIFVILGILMFAGPVLIPKIIAKIKSGKKPKTPFTPPQLSEQPQPTSVREITLDGEDVKKEE